VDDEYKLTGGMMNRDGMFGMHNVGQVVVEQYPIENDGLVLGVINITRTSSAENSFVAKMFKASLVRNSILSVVIAIFISVIIGYFISKKMSLALKETADLARDIQAGEIRIPKPTTIKEVVSIRESLDHLNSRLKLKQKSRKVLIDQLIHQSRTPLTVLKSHLEAMEDGLIDMNNQEISICQDQIDNIEAIISNMSGMIDANRETDDLAIDEFDFQPLISQIKEGLKAQFDKKDILFEQITHEKVMMETDKYKLSQAIYNVLTNAYKYTNPGGNVRVSYIVNEGNLFLKIQDTGIGIKEEDLEKIFTAYYRSDDAVITKGEGIGLYIAKENIERLNGTITVTSKKGTGSTFVIKVPLSSPL
jgi:signal transduction histidine kinase